MGNVYIKRSLNGALGDSERAVQRASSVLHVWSEPLSEPKKLARAMAR